MKKDNERKKILYSILQYCIESFYQKAIHERESFLDPLEKSGSEICQTK